MLPWGTKIRLEKQTGGTAWRLVASSRGRHAVPQALHCLRRRQIGNFEVDRELDPSWPRLCERFRPGHRTGGAILKQDFSTIYKQPHSEHRAKRPILSPERSLGSVIKLMTPSPEYTEAHNQWLATIPETIRQLLVTVKRYYRPDWGENWRRHFGVDRINGSLGTN